jgi:hypothetical protein
MRVMTAGARCSMSPSKRSSYPAQGVSSTLRPLDSITDVSGNRDRGKPRGFAPPTPPYVRVAYTAVRRIKHGRCFTPCRRVRQRSPSQRLRSFRAARLGFTLSRSSKASDLDIRPHSRFEVSMSKRPSIVQAFSENSFRLLRLLLTSAPWSGRLATTSVPIEDTAQISRGKIDRLRRTPVGSTTPDLDGYGLRDQ